MARLVGPGWARRHVPVAPSTLRRFNHVDLHKSGTYNCRKESEDLAKREVTLSTLRVDIESLFLLTRPATDITLVPEHLACP